MAKKNSLRKPVLSSCILNYLNYCAFSFIHQFILLYKFEELNYDLFSIYDKLVEMCIALGISFRTSQSYFPCNI